MIVTELRLLCRFTGGKMKALLFAGCAALALLGTVAMAEVRTVTLAVSKMV